MAQVKDEVVVLKSVNFSEADKILTVFGRNRGKFGLMAKGIRKMESKNRGNIQTMYISEISYFEGQNLGILRESEATLIPELNVKSLPRIEKVLYLLYHLMPEEESEPEIFEMVRELYLSTFTLRDVNRFRVGVLRHLGYLPDLKRCAICHADMPLKYVNKYDFTMICGDCYVKRSEGSQIEWSPVEEMRYESQKMDALIDNYVKNVVEGT